jgi:predicted AlkP superfamily pyrophosphatase or phosphodiesterase
VTHDRAAAHDAVRPTIGPTLEGSLGSHGDLADDPELQALFIASGRGIMPGVVLDRVNAVDVAPAAARLMGFEMEDVDGGC